jgi:hypothetical protein
MPTATDRDFLDMPVSDVRRVTRFGRDQHVVLLQEPQTGPAHLPESAIRAGRHHHPALPPTEEPFKAGPGSGRLRRPSSAGKPTSKEHRALLPATLGHRLTRRRIRQRPRRPPERLLGRASVPVRSPGQVHERSRLRGEQWERLGG